jgi:fimbrial chaperone protein
MRVSPMVSEISTRGAGSSARIEVQNVGSAALPYETRITRIDFDDEGDLVETPADEDFLVFPPQGVVPVGGRQVIRVQWVGDPDLAVSRAYYVGIRQLPVELDEPTEDGVAARVQVVYHMKSLVTVAPPGVKADVAVLSVKPVEVSGVPAAPEIDPALTGGQPAAAAEAPVETLVPGIEVRVRNSGRRYALMSGATWIVEGVGPDGKVTEVRLDNTAVNEAVGVGYVAPIDGERVFRLPTGIRFAGDKPIRVRFSQ